MKGVIVRQDIPGLLVMIVLGLIITIIGFVKLKNAMETNKWPITYGTVTGSVIGGAIKYYPSVNYTYMVDSTVYSSNRISNMNFSTKNRSVVEDVLKKYPLSSKIKVYYNISDPSKAILEPGVNTGNILLFAFGLLILAIPILCVSLMKLEIKRA